MKPTRLASLAALSILLTTGCDKKSDDSAVAQKLAELERKANEATERNRQLEQENQEQKLAAERDAIERERLQIEEERQKIEQQQTDANADEAEKLREREQALAIREGKAEQLQESLEEKEDEIQQRVVELSDRDRDLAGREAISLEKEDVQSAPVGDYGMFYDSLSSYGSWFETPDYGYVWQPVIVRESSWRPYTRGRWACSDRGWTWMSDEPFGWATYHYGRWALLRDRGWIWVPGSEWAPSWCSWRSSSSHIGWAPLPPETLAYRRHHWDSTVDATFGIGSLWFSFVETRNFGRPILHHCLPYNQNNIFIQQTVNITNIYSQNNRIICGGPKYNDIRSETGGTLPFYRLDLDRHDRPGRNAYDMKHRIHGDRLRVAAPDMDVAWNHGLKPGHIKGRLDNITVERPEALRPEIADHFRKNFEEHRLEADESISKMGGKEQFNRQRMEQFETNRRQLEEQARVTAAARETKGKNGRDNNGRINVLPKVADLPAKENEEALRNQQLEHAKQQQLEAQRDQLERAKLEQQEARRQQLENAQRDQLERAKLEQQEARRQQLENARGDQLERAKQQQQDAQRKQLEKAQREQAERAKLEQQQQQQQDAQREQAERTRQQQENQREKLENARREQAERSRQQQQDAQREQAERARQQQQDAQREQAERARQQQQEAQREQAERARQQQQEAQREQAERARQQQQEAQREQTERARQQQQEQLERAKKQQDEQDTRNRRGR